MTIPLARENISKHSTEAVSRKASACMHLVGEDALPHPRVLIHDPLCFINIGIENTNPFGLTPVRDGADDEQ